MPYSFDKFCKALAILTASALAASCSPLYSIGVRGALSRPMTVDCILNVAQTTEGIQQVLIHQQGMPSWVSSRAKPAPNNWPLSWIPSEATAGTVELR